MLYRVENVLTVLDLLFVCLTNLGVLSELFLSFVIISYRDKLLSKSSMFIPPLPELV